MTSYAGAIAAKLQDAHERRQRHEQQRGEDKDMDEKREQVARGRESLAGLWDDDLFVQVMKLNERVGQLLGDIAASGHAPGDIAASGHAPGDPQASAVSAERVVALERQLAEAREKLTAYSGRIRELEDKLAQAESHGLGMSYEHGRAEDEAAGLRELLATAYVAREVPWTDVAAGMMTLSREDHPRPWMVRSQGAGTWVLSNGLTDFAKFPADGETVRVLEPYVTPEQAETLVVSELGGRA